MKKNKKKPIARIKTLCVVNVIRIIKDIIQ